MIIWLASYPRSGNTLLRIWLKEIFDLESYSKYNDSHDIGADKKLAQQVGHCEYKGKWEKFYEESSESSELRLIKTHDLPEDDQKAIFVLRDGRAVAISYLNYLKQFSQLENDLPDVVAGAVEFGSWADHVEGWDPLNRPNTLFLKYESMIENPSEALNSIGRFLGRTVGDGNIPDFKELQRLKPEFFKTGSNTKNIKQMSSRERAYTLSKFGPMLKEHGYIGSLRHDKVVAAAVSKEHQQRTLKLKRQLSSLSAKPSGAGGTVPINQDNIAPLILKIDKMRAEQAAVSERQGTRIAALEKSRESLDTLVQRIDKMRAEAQAVAERQGQRALELQRENSSQARKLEKLTNNENSLKSLLSDAQSGLAKSVSDIETAREQKELQTIEVSKKTAELSKMTAEVSKMEAVLETFTKEHDKAMKLLREYTHVLQPRLKTLLELRPIRHVLKSRRQTRIEGNSNPLGKLLTSNQILSRAGVPKNYKGARSSVGTAISQHSGHVHDHGSFDAKPKAGSISQPAIVPEKQPMGIAVYTFDRHERVHDVLESLAQQNVLDQVHVWIDGDQGKPKLRETIDQTTALVEQYAVKKIHRNRGNFGFRKMMITSQRYMLERYDKIIFLEDDCFPVRDAIEQFSRELDAVKDNAAIFSVYGHPFGVPGEGAGFNRFQGWGWATTSEKLLPVWRELLELYMLTEQEYLGFVEEHLTDELLAKLDATPGRQPSQTIRNFFAWDEALAMITAMKGLKHKMSDKRLIYNCGLGDNSAHFTKQDIYHKPPFNMIDPQDVWDYF